MAIRTVVTRGFGNGTFNGTISLVVTRGYAIGAIDTLEASDQNIAFFIGKNRAQVAPFSDRVGVAEYKARARAALLKDRAQPAPMKNRVKTS